VYFDETDVVRHPLVQSIIRAYDRARERKATGTGVATDASSVAKA
jgi:phosphate starvation-inducible protein PhoH